MILPMRRQSTVTQYSREWLSTCPICPGTDRCEECSSAARQAPICRGSTPLSRVFSPSGASNQSERQVATDGWWPALPVTLTSIQTSDSTEQRLVVIPGQFLATGSSAGLITGTEQLYTNLTVELIRSSQPDHTPPTVTFTDLVLSGNVVTATVRAQDQGAGIGRIVLDRRTKRHRRQP